MSFDKKPREHKRGFTLVELVIVIAVIALLAAVLIPAFSGIIQKAKHSAALQEARGALTAFAVNTAAQTGAGGSDVYVVSKFENGLFYFTCESGELKDAPEGSLNRSLEDGEIIRVAVDDSYLIEGETGLEMSDALSSALAEIFGQEPQLNQHDDKAFVSLGGKTLEIASQPNLGDTMVFVSLVSLAGTSASSGDVYNDYEIRYAIENKYSIHKDYGPVAGSIMLIITHPDDIPFDWNFQNDYFKLYDEQWNTPSVKYEIQPNYNDKNQIYSVTITVYNLYCNIIISTDEDKETAMNTSGDNSSIPEQNAEESSDTPGEESGETSFPRIIFLANVENNTDVYDYPDNNFIFINQEPDLRGMSIKICIYLSGNYKATMNGVTFNAVQDSDNSCYIIIENVTDNIYISETE